MCENVVIVVVVVIGVSLMICNCVCVIVVCCVFVRFDGIVLLRVKSVCLVDVVVVVL